MSVIITSISCGIGVIVVVICAYLLVRKLTGKSKKEEGDSVTKTTTETEAKDKKDSAKPVPKRNFGLLGRLFRLLIVIAVVSVAFWKRESWWPVVKEFANRQSSQRQVVVQQPAITTETRRVTDMEFCAPVMVNGSQYRASTVPDIPIIVRINGDRIVHLKRESEGGTVDLGSGINTLEYKADGPYIATVSVDIKHW